VRHYIGGIILSNDLWYITTKKYLVSAVNTVTRNLSTVSLKELSCSVADSHALTHPQSDVIAQGGCPVWYP